jgi:hypothetical protein
MSVALEFEVDPGGTDAALVRLLGGLADRTRLNRFVANRGRDLTLEYLRRISATRHKTAQGLGATPTGHLNPERKVTGEGKAEAAEIAIRIPGIGRAFEDKTITPVRSKYLTLPAAAESYGKRAREFNDLRLAVFKGGALLALVRREAGETRVLYWLKTSVLQRQDRTLLPSDAAYMGAAEEGTKDFIRALIAAQQQEVIA